MAQHPVCGKKVFYRDICRSCVNKHKEEANNYAADIQGSPHEYMLRSAKARAKEEGIPFDLEAKDVCIPTKCPVLGIMLKFNTGHSKDDSASLDRIVPSLGYVRGNVAVISAKANRMKQENTLEDLEQIVNYIKNGIAFSSEEKAEARTKEIEARAGPTNEEYISAMKHVINDDELCNRLSKASDPNFDLQKWNTKTTKWMKSLSPNEGRLLMIGMQNCMSSIRNEFGDDAIDGDTFDEMLEHLSKRILRMRS